MAEPERLTLHDSDRAGIRRIFALAAFLVAGVGPLAAFEPDPVYLDNEELRLGIDRASGGAIFHFGASRSERNLLNHADRGRFIQQSFYGQRDGSLWNRKPWRWNPVQGGNWKGKPAKLLRLTIDPAAHCLYARTVPHHWAGDELLPEALMEQWITLRGPIAEVRYRFTHDGTTAHPPTHQELPAVFADYALPNLVFYDGLRPWTGAPLRRLVPGWPNESQTATESWAAYVDDKDWGLGVCFPGSTALTTYRHPGPPGPAGSGCSYFAPIRTLAVTRNFKLDYTIYLTIGTTAEIRSRFADLAAPHEGP